MNLPTNLADVFEFMAACDLDPINDDKSTLWVFLSYLNVSDLLVLSGLCKSSYQLST